MDPVTHSMVGAALADGGGRKHTPLAATTLILAANAPDIDIVAQFGGTYAGLAWRRGITHGLPALFVLPFLVLGVILALDRLRRWRHPDRAPVRRGPTLALAFLGVLTHPFLDWLNTYGMRWLMPLDGRWFYGDAVFIIDPWLWLALGGALFVLHSHRTPLVIAWGALAAAMSFLVLFQPIVPLAGKVLWVAGITGFVLIRLGQTSTGNPANRASLIAGRPATIARVALAGASLYILGMIALDMAAERNVRGALTAAGLDGVGDIMVGPDPGHPFSGSIIAATPGAYHLGTFRWFRSPRADIERTIPLAPPGPAVAAAIRTEEARDFLVWSRFPYYQVTETSEGYAVRIGDARYAEAMGAGGLAGLTILLDREYRPRQAR